MSLTLLQVTLTWENMSCQLEQKVHADSLPNIRLQFHSWVSLTLPLKYMMNASFLLVHLLIQLCAYFRLPDHPIPHTPFQRSQSSWLRFHPRIVNKHPDPIGWEVTSFFLVSLCSWESPWSGIRIYGYQSFMQSCVLMSVSSSRHACMYAC